MGKQDRVRKSYELSQERIKQARAIIEQEQANIKYCENQFKSFLPEEVRNRIGRNRPIKMETVKKDKICAAVLRRNPKIEPTLNYIVSRFLPYDHPVTEKYAEDNIYVHERTVTQRGGPEHPSIKKSVKMEYRYMLLFVNDAFYERATRKLNCSESSIQKIISRCCDYDMARKARRWTHEGVSGCLYEIGYFDKDVPVFNKDGSGGVIDFLPRPFLVGPKIKTMLRGMNCPKSS